MNKDDVLSIIGNELSNSFTDESDLAEALNLYLGNPNGEEVEGRSTTTSTDVADTIEWIMPQIMKSFTQNNEIVIFDPVHDGDETQAELESEYVYDVIMKQNNGFVAIHQMVKDALMQRNGILKVYYDKTETTTVKEFTGIPEQQLMALLAVPNSELLEQSSYVDEVATQQKKQQLSSQMQAAQQQAQQTGDNSKVIAIQKELAKPVQVHDVRVAFTDSNGKIVIDPVAPEEFRIAAGHNSIDTENVRFSAHVTSKTVSDIRKEYDISEETLKDLPSDTKINSEDYRFALQEGSALVTSDTDNGDDSQREVDVAECYINIDIDDTGIAKLMKITVVGVDTPTDILSIEEVDRLPWVTVTPIIMSHKFQGRSITDRIKEIQQQKTAVLRNTLDNFYLQNNQRTIIVDNQVEIADLLVSRPGGVIRTKNINAIAPLVTPAIGDAALNTLGYLDKVRAGRTGVEADGTATPQDIGDRVGSNGVDRMMSAKEELVGLIIRVIAETGIKPLCCKVRDLAVEHTDAITDFRFRGVWRKVNPAKWPERTKTTVRVGTGSGDHNRQVAALQAVLQIQKEIVSNPKASLVTQKEAYAALDDFCKYSGLNGASRYFLDPESPKGKQLEMHNNKKSEEDLNRELQMQQAMAKSQLDLAAAEQAKAQAQIYSAQSKAQVEAIKNQLTLQKQTSESETKLLKQQLEEAKAVADATVKSADLALRKYTVDQQTTLELTRIEADKLKEQNDNYTENMGTVSE